MAATFGDLTEEVIAYLHGFTGDAEQVTSLSVGITSTATSFTVTDPTSVSNGLVEIGEELVRVVGVNQATSTVTVPPWGRGQQASVPAAHSAGVRVTNSPRFPRSRVKTVINEVIVGMYPDLFGVVTDTTLTASPSRHTYSLPADVRSIVSISWDSNGPSGAWVPVNRYRLDRSAATSEYPNGVSVDILTPMDPGRTIKVVYRRALTPLSADADLLTATGLLDSARDVVVWGALAQLLPALEFSRLQNTTVEQSDRSRLVQPGSANSAARNALQMHSLRLGQERLKLLQTYPTTVHQTR